MGLPVSQIEVERLKGALLESGGVVSEAARILGCDRYELNRKVVADEELAGYRQSCRVVRNEVKAEEAEAVLFDALKGREIKRSQLRAAEFTLECLGKHLGWVRRSEVTGPRGGPIAAIAVPVRFETFEEWRASQGE